MPDNKIFVIMALKLIYPYVKSVEVAVDFAQLWHCRIIASSTQRGYAILAMPWDRFQIIFDGNPIVGDYKPPKGSEHFIEKIRVSSIKEL